MGESFRVAAVQAAYVLMDREATTRKVEQLIVSAAAEGARLIVFPEVFVPGTPIWIDAVPIWDGDEAWFARLVEGKTVAVVGDGAVGLLGVLAAKQLGAERIMAMSRHQPRQQLAREFGATEIVTERGDEGVARIKELTNGLGAHSVIEAVGTQESMMQAIRSTRQGGHVGFVGVAHGVQLPGEEMFFSHVHLHGGPAPVRRFLPELIDLIWNRTIKPGRVFDLELPLDEAADGYKAMDQRRAIKVLLRP